MQPTTAGTRHRGRAIIAVISGCAVLLMTLHLVRSQNIAVPQRHPTGHVDDHVDQTWPPQPQGITNIVVISNPDDDEKKRHLKSKQRFDKLEQLGAARADLKEALGRRFTRIVITDEKNKDGTPRPGRYTYFSRDKNATVEALFDGANITSVKSTPANEYQPEITDEEILEATELARQHFLRLGLTRVQDLKGYGILAYRPEGKGFYNGRVIYVSFHADADAPPELMAWVDLTSQTILKYREER